MKKSLFHSIVRDLRDAKTNPSATPWDLLLFVCAVASIVPLFCARHLPMSDLPEHLAAMATLRHYGDPSWKSADYFTVAGVLDTPYWLYHGTGALLSVVTGSAERANIVMLSVVGLAYPYALRTLLVALKKDPRLALFGCGLFWSTNLIVGILNFVASVPVVLFALALVIRQSERSSLRRSVGLASLAIAIFYLHLSSFALLVLDAALLTWILRGRPQGFLRSLLVLPRRLLWLAPAGALGLVVFLRGHTIRAGADHGSLVVWQPRVNILGSLHTWLFDTFRSKVDDVLGISLVILLGLLISRRRTAVEPDASAQESAQETRGETPSAKQLAWCGYALAGSAFLVRVFSPSQVGPEAFLLDTRMSIFVGLFAILLPTAILASRKGAAVFVAAALVTLGLSFNAASEVHAFERDEVAGFDDLLRAMPHGKRLVMLNMKPISKHTNSNVFSYFGSYYRARYGGVASFSFSETSHWPVQYKDGARPPTPMAWGSPCVYRNRRDGAYFDYVLVRSEASDHDPWSRMPAGPRFELVGASRAWTLFKKVDDGSATSNDDLDVEDSGPCRPRG